jgi:regulator of protease activity HflC (stomatin/prohibitin superfamily)
MMEIPDLHCAAEPARGARRWPRRGVAIGAALALLTCVALLSSAVAIVPAGYRGVLTTLGKPSMQVYGEGAHLRVPLLQQMNLMDVRVARREGEGDAASRDLQSVRVKVILNYHLDPAAAVQAFRDIAPSTEELAVRIIDPARPEAFKAVTARFTAEELIGRRAEVREQIAALLREKMQRHGLVLDEFAIANFAFSPSFTSAIEAKVNAEQEKLKADRDLMRIRVEAEQRIASAHAEAESLRLQRQEVTPLLLELRRTENERLAIHKWNGQLPTTTLGGNTQPLLNLGAGR